MVNTVGVTPWLKAIEARLPNYGVAWRLVKHEEMLGVAPGDISEIDVHVPKPSPGMSGYSILAVFQETAKKFGHFLDEALIGEFRRSSQQTVGTSGTNLISYDYDRAAFYLGQYGHFHDLKLLLHPSELMALRREGLAEFQPAALSEVGCFQQEWFSAFTGLFGAASIYSLSTPLEVTPISSRNFLFHPSSALIETWPLELADGLFDDEDGLEQNLILPFRITVRPERVVELRGTA